MGKRNIKPYILPPPSNINTLWQIGYPGKLFILAVNARFVAL
jgi:hypothetical protein